MSDYHVLDATNDGSGVTVAVHIPVPPGTNIAGNTYSACLAEDPDEPKTSVVPSISASERNALTAGTLYEYVMAFETHRDVPNATKQARLEARVANIKNNVGPERIRQHYWGWGFEGNV